MVSIFMPRLLSNVSALFLALAMAAWVIVGLGVGLGAGLVWLLEHGVWWGGC
jgi:hypothetical protein